MDKEPITLNGLNKLKDELIFLKEKKRPEIVAAIAEARSHGDLKENAEYHAAKEEQSHNEGRITEINDIIARANVIDVTKLNNDGKVIFGSTVFLENLDTGEKINYKIVGKDEKGEKRKTWEKKMKLLVWRGTRASSRHVNVGMQTDGLHGVTCQWLRRPAGRPPPWLLK